MTQAMRESALTELRTLGCGTAGCLVWPTHGVAVVGSCRCLSDIVDMDKWNRVKRALRVMRELLVLETVE